MKKSGQLSVADVIVHIMWLYSALGYSSKNPMPLDYKTKLIDEFIGAFSDGANTIYLKNFFKC